MVREALRPDYGLECQPGTVVARNNFPSSLLLPFNRQDFVLTSENVFVVVFGAAPVWLSRWSVKAGRLVKSTQRIAMEGKFEGILIWVKCNPFPLACITVVLLLALGTFFSEYLRLVVRTSWQTTLRVFGGWRSFAIPPILFGAGVAMHSMGLIYLPSLEALVGKPENQAASYLIYGVLAVVGTTAACWLGALAYAPFAIYSHQESKIAQLSPDDNLDLYFHSRIMASGQQEVQYSDLTITNRSEKTMNLQFWGGINYSDDEGVPQRLWMQAELNPDGLKQHTGSTYLELGREQSVVSVLFVFLPEPNKHGRKKWKNDMLGDVLIKVVDSVSGKREVFWATPGYPAGRVAEEDLPPVGKEAAKQL